MAKTINPAIDIFFSREKAETAFNKCESADLLRYVPRNFEESTDTYYVDKSKSAYKAWPKKYVLIKTK